MLEQRLAEPHVVPDPGKHPGFQTDVVSANQPDGTNFPGGIDETLGHPIHGNVETVSNSEMHATAFPCREDHSQALANTATGSRVPNTGAQYENAPASCYGIWLGV